MVTVTVTVPVAVTVTVAVTLAVTPRNQVFEEMSGFIKRRKAMTMQERKEGVCM